MAPNNSLIKRQVSQSDNCSIGDNEIGSPNSAACDEPSRHSKVARTHLGVMKSEYAAALDHILPKGDDGSDRDKSNLEAQEGTEDALTQLSRKEDSFWLKFLTGSPHCCTKCKSMTGTPEGLAALLSDDGYKHFNWYRIQEMAAFGCALCRAIWDVTESQDWDHEEDGSVTQDEIRIFANATHRSSSAESRLSRRNIFENDADHGIADPASGLVPGRRESKELHPIMVSKIRRWLDDCLNKHPSCPRSCSPDLPRRVLDVGTDNSTARPRNSLANEKAQYASLSYCWGSGDKHVATTNSNLRDHSVALPRQLPKTISDAIQVCRKIGIRYLWIDALCIIQDDRSDMLDQIAKMGSIYKNSTLTIVAASAERVTDGFLSNASPNEPSTQLPIFIDDSTCGTVYLRMQDSHFIYSSDEPVFQRAWTFQELLLSPRALIFDSSQITLKCIGEGFQPVLDTYVNFNFGCSDLPVSIFGLVDKNFARRNTQESREYYLKVTQNQIWTTVIYEYSQRDLTFFDDRLPAIAGIAAELANVWDDVYLAGFWKKTIIHHLG
ncbi:hypothetical protein CLAIMM_08057 [Cladophialophora immunda]|nr:hypothetical protein CLAIMM_08057 [Cladophialophora immunda]